MVGKRKGIQSVEIGVGVLDALVKLGRPSTLSEVAKASDLSASQAHRYLASFVNTGFLRQDPATALYDLHAGALRLGLAAMARLDVFEEASQVAQEVVAATGRTILLAIWSDLGPTIVRWYPGSPPVYTTLAIGSRLSLTMSATGRVFLAFLNETYVSDFLQRELVLERTNGPVDIDALRQQVRRDLIAAVDGTIIPGLRAYAVPIFNVQGQLVLVMSAIASQSFAVDADAAVKQRLIAAGQEVTHRLGGRWPEMHWPEGR
ncbi:transcriptional regulator [Aliidongia dinghuensis]|uniref:Transcriptional regulator n=1 Tax=Aliidongia dinghuensis TaxID=1867774 RepID=A0A8J2YPE8_9PROT|nr:IclR family transcriptional regulator [Aliidongia dinghuensis]GGE98982.1 transcriptional regulator [Aliidongia dinghuensis]